MNTATMTETPAKLTKIEARILFALRCEGRVTLERFRTFSRVDVRTRLRLAGLIETHYLASEVSLTEAGRAALAAHEGRRS